ncbi:acetoacetate decarboxylase, partial [Escherichia coli]|uniref:acetoacetate decarboxylase n=1 Tax=Escherichia coli TaxID=562 RepID=UPI0015C80A7D
VEEDTLIGILKYGSIDIAIATMGYKHRPLDAEKVLESVKKPVFLLKNIPNVDGTPLVNQLTKTYLTDVTVKGAWTGPGSLELHPHALAPISNLYIKKIVSVSHFITDLTLPYGEVVADYFA